MELLYAIRGCAYPQSSKTHASFAFLVPPGYERITAEFQYDPITVTDETEIREIIEQALLNHREDEDMVRLLHEQGFQHEYMNLLTLSFDDPEKYRGAAHRFESHQRLVISREEASHGLIRGDILPGLWKAVVSFHSVYAKECSFSLQVWGGK